MGIRKGGMIAKIATIPRSLLRRNSAMPENKHAGSCGDGHRHREDHDYGIVHKKHPRSPPNNMYWR